MHRYKDAISDCWTAIKNDNKCIKANLIFTRCYKHRGNFDKAKEHLRKGLDKTKGNDYLSLYIPNLKDEVILIIIYYIRFKYKF